MTRAEASRTSESSDEKPIRPIRDPSVQPPSRVERTKKEPGSLVYSLNKWFRVQPDGSLVEETE